MTIMDSTNGNAWISKEAKMHDKFDSVALSIWTQKMT